MLATRQSFSYIIPIDCKICNQSIKNLGLQKGDPTAILWTPGTGSRVKTFDKEYKLMQYASFVFLAFFGSEQFGSQQEIDAAANFVHHIRLFTQQRGDLGGKINYAQQPEGTGDDEGQA